MIEEALLKYLRKNNFPRIDLKAVLFDMDGVLYDSMKFHARSWHEVMNEQNIENSSDEFYLFEGMTGHNTINHMMKRGKGREATAEEKEHIYQRKTQLFNTYNDGSLIPYAYEFVKKVSDDGLKCLVVTGSGQRSLIDKLEIGFPGLFQRELMVTAYDVKFGKPHPEPFLMGLEKAGNLNPCEAIVIENAPRGVEAASAAGIFAIAVNTGPLQDKVLSDSGADIVFPSMKALNANWATLKKIIHDTVAC